MLLAAYSVGTVTTSTDPAMRVQCGCSPAANSSAPVVTEARSPITAINRCLLYRRPIRGFARKECAASLLRLGRPRQPPLPKTVVRSTPMSKEALKDLLIEELQDA